MAKNSRMLALRLEQIAKSVGLPTEFFFIDRKPSGKDIGDKEITMLWSMIKSDGGRERILECIRDVLDEERR